MVAGGWTCEQRAVVTSLAKDKVDEQQPPSIRQNPFSSTLVGHTKVSAGRHQHGRRHGSDWNLIREGHRLIFLPSFSVFYLQLNCRQLLVEHHITTRSRTDSQTAKQQTEQPQQCRLSQGTLSTLLVVSDVSNVEGVSQAGIWKLEYLRWIWRARTNKGRIYEGYEGSTNWGVVANQAKGTMISTGAQC